jgi:hypothetical protein
VFCLFYFQGSSGKWHMAELHLFRPPYAYAAYAGKPVRKKIHYNQYHMYIVESSENPFQTHRWTSCALPSRLSRCAATASLCTPVSSFPSRPGAKPGQSINYRFADKKVTEVRGNIGAIP